MCVESAQLLACWKLALRLSLSLSGWESPTTLLRTGATSECSLSEPVHRVGSIGEDERKARMKLKMKLKLKRRKGNI